MDDQAKNRAFREIKALTVKQFWSAMNRMHSRAYSKAIQEVHEALSCHPRVTKPMIKQIFDKLNEIREDWDQMPQITAEDTINFQYRTTDEIIHGNNPTESEILAIESEQEITIKGKRYLIKPVD